MNRVWFKPRGWLYRPTSWQGIALVLLTAVFCMQVFLAIDRHSHSFSNPFYGVFPCSVRSVMLLNWVVSKTSHQTFRAMRG